MASEDVPMSLLSLEEELSCSICLSPFDCPVTIPCGHNFCQDCLLSTWKDAYSCPQCRTVFATRPELKKNTVLSAVAEAFRTRSGLLSQEAAPPPKKAEVICCDTCMEAEAVHTCLTCMASFCLEHVKPHQDNPVFRLHQLGAPTGDLTERICPDHNKLMELFCSQHQRLICSLCLQQEHKGCSFTSQEEQRRLKESDFRDKMSFLNNQIQKTVAVKNQMSGAQIQLKEAADDKKKILAAVYQQIRDLLAQDEREAQREMDRELETGDKKLQETMNTLSKNTEKMVKARETIESLLAQSQNMTFLKASFELPKVTKFEPRVPQISLDSRRVKAMHTFTSGLKENLEEILHQPFETRSLLLKPGGKEKKPPVLPKTEGPRRKPKTAEPAKNTRQNRTRSKSPGRPLVPPQMQHFNPFTPPQMPFMPLYFSAQQPGQRPQPPAQFKAQEPGAHQESEFQWNPSHMKFVPKATQWTKAQKPSNAASDLSSAEKRSDLLKHGVMLTFDPNTSHRRIVLSDAFTKASLSDEQAAYANHPKRFDHCTQVLAAQSFSRNRHYWELQVSSHKFVGVGLAYSSMDRKGPASRLGRNAQSWCVEWCNGRTSAWHDGSETLLHAVTPKRVGVLLDCEEGVATFYNVADRAYPFHTFVFPFAEPVHPAFWIFSSDSTISICRVQTS